MNPQDPPPPWHAVFPSPSTTLPVPITRSELLNKFRQGHEPGVDFLLIDLRRIDFEVRTSATHRAQDETFIITGWNNSRLAEPTSPDNLSQPPNYLESMRRHKDQIGDILLQ